jgi:hypothetical protein
MCRPQSIPAEDPDVLFDNGEDISQHMNDERTEPLGTHRGSFKFEQLFNGLGTHPDSIK